MSLIRFLPIALVAIMFVGDLTAQDERPRRDRGQRGARQTDRQRGPGGPRSLPIIAALDADQDGEISAEEIENAVAALKKLDENGDGKLTGEEIMPRGRGRFGGGAGFGGGRGGGFGGGTAFVDRIFERDEDKDGKLSKQEVPERMAERFDQMDADSDGYITKKELTDAFASFGGGRRGDGGDGAGDRPRRRQRPE